MAKTLLLLCVLAADLAVGLAIICEYRTGDLPNVTVAALQQTCNATGSFCYSYSSYGSNLVNAGCSSSATCTLPSCVFCTNADRCNSVVPSAIRCFTRNANSTDNGTDTACSTGISSCYTQFSRNGYAGCGNCTTAAAQFFTCRQCSTDLCNSNTPSVISCYSRSPSTSATSDGTLTVCATGTSTCFSHSDGEAGCGGCTATSTSSYGCTSCSTNGCNTMPIKCYSRSSTAYYSGSALSNGTSITCSTGSTSCYTKHATGEGGCGSCTSSYLATYGCVSCSTDNCNTATPSSIGCYTRAQGGNLYTSSTCPTGVSSCYWHNNKEAGCGICTSDSSSTYGCKSCSTNYCNNVSSAAASEMNAKMTTASTMVLVLVTLLTKLL